MTKHNRPLTSRLAAHVGTQHIHLLDKLDLIAQEVDVFVESWLEELAKRNVRDRVFLVAVLSQLPNIISKYVYDQLTRAGRETAEMMAVAIVRSLPVEYYPLEMETQESIGSIKAVFRKGVAAVKGYVGKKAAYTKDEFKRRLHQYLIEPLSADVLEKIVLSGARNLAWLKQRIFQTVNPQAVADKVVQATSAGKSQKEITAILKNEYAIPKRDAVRITRNEGTRIATESNLQAYEQLGDAVIGYMIHAVLDERTRPEHRKRNGQIYYKEPKGNQKGLDEMPKPPVEADGTIAWNCRCVLGDSYVHGPIKSICRSLYTGQFVKLRTRGGATLTVTANHPIATNKGMIAAYAIRKGDYLISDSIRSRKFANNINDGIPTIEEIFKTLSVMNGFSVLKRPDALEFHGDGQFMQGEIRMVRADGGLMDNSFSESVDGLHEGEFVRGALRTMRPFGLPGALGFSHSGPFDSLSIRSGTKFNASFHQHAMQSKGLSVSLMNTATINAKSIGNRFHGITSQVASDDFRGSFPLGFTPPQNSRFFFSPNRDPVFDKASPNNLIARANFFHELVDRYTGEIAFDDVVAVDYFFDTTHVYSIDAGIGYYTGSDNRVSLVQGNCWLQPVFRPIDGATAEPFINADKKIVPDPLVFDDWFSDASERLKRRAVGSRRYDVVTAKHGTDASYFHFIDPDNGDLLDLDSIRTETATDTATRVMQGRQQANDARLQRRDVLLFGSNQ